MKIINKKSFISDALKISSAPIIIQIIGFFTLPIISRIYGPESFGEFNLILSLLGPVGIIVTLGYDTAIMKYNSIKKTSLVVIICMINTITLTLISFLLIKIFKNEILEILKLDYNKSFYLYILPLSMLFSGITSILRYWNLKHQYFLNISLSTILSTSSDKITSITMGLIGYNTSFGLVSGLLMDTIIRPISLLFVSGKNIFKSCVVNFNKQEVINMYNENKKYPLFIMPSNLLARINIDSTVYLLFIFFSKSIVGTYGLCLKVLHIPVNLIGNSIGEIYFQRESSNKQSHELLQKIFRLLVFIGLFPFMSLLIVGEELFVYVFGKEWIIAGQFSEILSLSVFFKLITTPSSYLTLIHEKQQISLYQKGLTFISIITSLYIGDIYDSYYLGFILLSITTSITYISFGFYLMSLSNIKLSFLINIILNILFKSLPFIILLFYLKTYIINSNLVLILSTIFLIILYYIIVLKSEPIIKKEIKHLNQ